MHFEVGKVTDQHPYRLTVVRFSSGDWSCDGSPDDSEYGAEIYLVACPRPRPGGWFDDKKYIRKAQAWRSRNKGKVEGSKALRSLAP